MSSLSLGVRADADPDVRAFVVRFWADVHDRAAALPCAVKVTAGVGGGRPGARPGGAGQ